MGKNEEGNSSGISLRVIHTCMILCGLTIILLLAFVVLIVIPIRAIWFWIRSRKDGEEGIS